MVVARAVEAYFNRKLKEMEERRKTEEWEANWKVGRAEGIAEYAAWLRRREEAEARGDEFDEPPPGS